MDVIRYNEISLKRNLDGKGRVILPGDLRESARFAADEEPKARLAFIWASENIATNMPGIYADHMPV